MVKRIISRGDRFRLTFEHDGTEHDVEADRIVNGAGRIANVDTLELEAGRVRHIDGRIETDEYLRSASNAAVHICGWSLVKMLSIFGDSISRPSRLSDTPESRPRRKSE